MFIYWRDTHRHGWELMSGVLLCITGVEAMYADLGHFSRRAVQVRALASHGFSVSGSFPRPSHGRLMSRSSPETYLAYLCLRIC